MLCITICVLGLLLINVYGNNEWLQRVHALVSPVARQYEYHPPVYLQLTPRYEYDSSSGRDNNRDSVADSKYLNYLYTESETNTNSNVSNSNMSIVAEHRQVAEQVNNYNYVLVCYPQSYQPPPSSALSRLFAKNHCNNNGNHPHISAKEARYSAEMQSLAMPGRTSSTAIFSDSSSSSSDNKNAETTAAGLKNSNNRITSPIIISVPV